MSDQRDQHKAGIPAKRRGQQTGFAGNRDQNREEMADTPAVSGRRTSESEFFGEDSLQHVGSNSARPNTNSPSVPAFDSGGHKGDTGGEIAFKEQQQKRTSSE